MFTLFETSRLTVCRIQLESDLPSLLVLHNHRTTMRWIPNNKLTWTVIDLEKKYNINQQAYEKQLGIYKIAWKENTAQTFIGEVGLFLCQDTTTTVEIGYILHEFYWKKGFATELLHGLESFIKEYLPYTTIRAQLFEHNINSKKLLERCGYQCVATIPLHDKTAKLVYTKSLSST
ncbi:GNAT family N-acetyltransferase [Myroides sp. WP-1]|uniref:GNAT family N-acetyltransferase n=1 Tax=Myroides sp. WP-1 TaxID=2759944 RepID=UPI0015FE78B2|nr:GNAT family protein [Myroides sp. WP-1]MBB1140849.1 GNAT family N-acetyltransferase [Myroides sp. WP-1]